MRSESAFFSVERKKRKRDREKTRRRRSRRRKRETAKSSSPPHFRTRKLVRSGNEQRTRRKEGRRRFTPPRAFKEPRKEDQEKWRKRRKRSERPSSLSLSLSLYLLNQFNCGRTKEGRKEGVLSSSRQKKSLFVSVDWTPLAPIEGR